MQSKRLKIQERRFTGLRINSVELQTERQGQQQLWGEGWTLTGGRAGLPLRWKAVMSAREEEMESKGVSGEDTRRIFRGRSPCR